MPNTIVPPIQVSPTAPFPGDEQIPFVPPVEPTGELPPPGDEMIPPSFVAPESDVNAATTAPKVVPGRSSTPAPFPMSSSAPSPVSASGGFVAPESDLENAPFEAPATDQKRATVKDVIGTRTPEEIAKDKDTLPDIKQFFLEHQNELTGPERDALADAHVLRKDAGLGVDELLKAPGNVLGAGWDIVKGGFKASMAPQEFVKAVAQRVALGDNADDKAIANSLLKPAGELSAGVETMASNLVGLVRGLLVNSVNQEGTRFLLNKLGMRDARPRLGGDFTDPSNFSKPLTNRQQLETDAGLAQGREQLATGEGLYTNLLGLDASTLAERGITLDPQVIAFASIATDPSMVLPMLKGLQIASIAGRGFEVANAAGQVVARSTTREAAQAFVQKAAQAAQRVSRGAADTLGGIGKGQVAKTVGAIEALQGSPGLVKLGTAWAAKGVLRKGAQAAELGARALGSELGSRAAVAAGEGAATGAGIGAGLAASMTDPQEQADAIAFGAGLGGLSATAGTTALAAAKSLHASYDNLISSALGPKGLLTEVAPTVLNIPGMEKFEAQHAALRRTLSPQERAIGDLNRANIGRNLPDETAPGVPPTAAEQAARPMYYMTESEAIALDPAMKGKAGRANMTVKDANGNPREIVAVIVDNGHATANVHEPAHWYFDNILDAEGQQALKDSFSDEQVAAFTRRATEGGNYTAEQLKNFDARKEMAVEALGHVTEGRGLQSLPPSLKDRVRFLLAQGLERVGIYNPTLGEYTGQAQGSRTRQGIQVSTAAVKQAREALNKYLSDPAVKADLDSRVAATPAEPAAPTPAPGAPPVVSPVTPAGPTPEQVAQDNLVASVRKQFPKVADRYEAIIAKARRGETLTPGEQAQYNSIVAESARLGGARPSVPSPAEPAPVQNPNLVPADPGLSAPAPEAPPVITAPPVIDPALPIKPAPPAAPGPVFTAPPVIEPATPRPPNVRGVDDAAYGRFVGPAREPAQQRAAAAIAAIEADPNLSPEVAQANRTLLQNLGVPHEIVYDSAAETGSKSAESYRLRRQEVEAARNDPGLRAAASKLGVIPLDANPTKDGHQIQVWSGDAALVNLDRVLKQADALMDDKSIPYPMKNGKLTDGGAQLAQDLIDYTRNQNNGYKGDGTPLNRPANPQGFIPDVNPDYTPVKLSEDVANFANLLMGERPPKIARITPPTVPVPIRAKAIADVNARKGVETGPIFKAPYEGQPVMDFNPKRVAMEKLGYNFKDLNPVHERLNVNRVKSAKPRPDIKLEPTATDVTAAGFMEKPKPIEDFMGKPNEEIQDLAGGYMKLNGKPYTPHNNMVRPDRAELKRVADAYEAAKDNPNDPQVQASYNAFSDEIKAQWQYLVDNGYQFEIWDKPGQPYKNAKEMATDVRDNKHLYTFDSVSPESSPEITKGNPMFKPAGLFIGDREILVNDAFRQIHDIFGHAQNGFSFGPQGEWNAFLTHSRMFSKEARSAMQTETVGQNAWVNYGPHLQNEAGGLKRPGDEGFVIRRNRPFAEQKAVLLPFETGGDFMAKTTSGKDFEKAGYQLIKTPTATGSHMLRLVDPDTQNTVAFIQYGKDGKVGEVRNVNVSESLRKQGIGEMLYREALSDMRDSGIRSLEGSVIHDAPIAIRRKLLGEPVIEGETPGTRGAKPTLRVSNEIRPDMDFMPNPADDAIKSAAVQTADGQIFEGRWHLAAYDKAIEAGANLDNSVDGFVTNSGEFLGRKAALDRAVELEQVSRDTYEKQVKAYQEAEGYDFIDRNELETDSFDDTRDFMAQAPKKFWLEPNGTLKNAGADHSRSVADEVGIKYHPDNRGQIESAKMAKGAIRGNIQDDTLFFDGDRPWKDLPKSVRRKIEDLAYETGSPVNYNGRFIEDFSPGGGGDFMAKPTGWITPDGKYTPLEAAYHEQDLAANAAKYNAKFGTKFKNKANVNERLKALDAGFVRIRTTPNGDVKVEVDAKYWDKHKRAIKKRLNEMDSAGGVNDLYIAVSKNGKVIAEGQENIFMGGDVNDVVNSIKLPGGEAAKEPTNIQRIRALPGDFMGKLEGPHADLGMVKDFYHDDRFQLLGGWDNFGKELAPDFIGGTSDGKPKITVDQIKDAGFKSFDVVGNGSHHDSDYQAVFRKDEGGEYKLTEAEVKKAAAQANKDRIEDWEVAYGDGDFMAKRNANETQLELGKAPPPIDRYDRAKIQSMTPKELKAHWPEAIVGKEGPIGSDLVGSPLVKEFGLEEGARKAGDKLVARLEDYQQDPDVQLGRTWYSRFHAPLKKFFGPDAQVFTEFLAATSPQTQPKQNFETAWEAFRLYKAGWFDDLVNGFKQGLDKVNDGSLLKEYQRKVPKKDQPQNISDSTLLRWWIDEKNLKPTKAPRLNKDAAIEDSVMFNNQSVAVLKVAAREWMQNNGGPKTSQFVRNLLDMDHGATIDLWADRTMREATYADYVDRWRILPENGKGVADDDFAFAQSAFKHAADKLGWKPSEVQGALWFLEKRRWAEEGWSPLNLGDYLPHLEDLASKGSLEKELAKVPQTREKALADLKIQRKQAVEAQKVAEKQAKELEVAIRKAEKAQLGFDLDIRPARR